MKYVVYTAICPNLWTTNHNPMNSIVSKQKMICSQKRKQISVDGIIYGGVREAARQLSSYRQLVIFRLKSSHFPTWFYV